MNLMCEHCKKCNREMGYNPQKFELCAPCELGFGKKSDEEKRQEENSND